MTESEKLAMRVAELLVKFDWTKPMLDQAAHVVLAALKEDGKYLHSEIAKYRARLEVDHHFEGADLKRVEVPYISADEDLKNYDGIFCRDETIKLLEEQIGKRRTRSVAEGPDSPEGVNPK